MAENGHVLTYSLVRRIHGLAAGHEPLHWTIRTCGPGIFESAFVEGVCDSVEEKRKGLFRSRGTMLSATHRRRATAWAILKVQCLSVHGLGLCKLALLVKR